MIELVFYVCAVANPVVCKDVRMNFAADNVTPQQCMVFGQYEMAKWVSGHPKWQIKKWRCGIAGQLAKA